MPLFLRIFQVKFVTKTQSLINRLEQELCKILEPMFKSQQNKYDINTKKQKAQKNPKTPTNIWSLNRSIVYFLIFYIPIFPSPKNSTKEFRLSENFDYPKLVIKKYNKETTQLRQYHLSKSLLYI